MTQIRGKNTTITTDLNIFLYFSKKMYKISLSVFLLNKSNQSAQTKIILVVTVATEWQLSPSRHSPIQEHFSGIIYSGDTVALSVVGCYTPHASVFIYSSPSVVQFLLLFFFYCTRRQTHISKLISAPLDRCPLTSSTWSLGLYLSTVCNYKYLHEAAEPLPRSKAASVIFLGCIRSSQMQRLQQLAVNPRSHRPESAFIHFLASSLLKHFWKGERHIFTSVRPSKSQLCTFSTR